MSLVANSNHLRLLLKETYPATRLTLVYGSGAFAQSGRSKGKMLDIVFAVADPTKWHTENIRTNPSHYSVFARHASKSFLHKLQKAAAGVYYNPFVKLEGWDGLVKYGVISVDDLKKDLEEWSTLYVSGRMHKPVMLLDICSELNIASSLNLDSSVRTALLLLPEAFNLIELFRCITGISYKGDIRMGIAEDSKKIDNIVRGNYTAFKHLYNYKLFGTFNHCLHINTSDDVIQDKSIQRTKHHLQRLPYNLLNRLANNIGWTDYYYRTLPLEEFIQVTTDKHLEDLHAQLELTLEHIIATTSLYQSAKGILTAGLWKSTVYSFQKIKKGFGIS